MTTATSTAKKIPALVELRAQSVVQWISNRSVPLTLSRESQKQLCEQLGMTPAQLDSALTHLIDTGAVVVRPGMAGLVITSIEP